MLKPLETEFKGREISLECTHKKRFPPPQMYGHTPEDVDNLWKQGAIDQNQYQHLKVWKEQCGLMVMGPKCLDCPLALKRNPRPGRPNVIETENWLEAKKRMHWEDMKAGRLTPAEMLAQGNTGVTEFELDEDDAPEEPELDEEDAPDEPEPDETAVHDSPSKKTLMEVMVEESVALPDADKIKLGDEEFDVEKKEDLVAEGLPDPSTPIVTEGDDDEGLGDDVLDALAED